MLINNQRLSELLKCIIDYYIKNANPISSNELITSYHLDRSSATIRNEMVKLEELGYITKHHFASGRIPTTKGYQYYVENLMGDSNIANIQKQLNILFHNRMLSVNEIIDKACEIISDITNVATLHKIDINEKKYVNKIDLLPLDDNSAVILLVTSDNKIFNKIITINEKIDKNELKSAISYINKRISEISLHDIKNNVNFLKPIINKDVQEYEILLEDIIKSIINNTKYSASIYGVNNVIKNPEFANYQQIQSVLEILKNSSIWDYLNNLEYIDKNKNSQKFKISLCDNINENKDLAVISTSIKLANFDNSQITVIGPKRMDYDKITTLLAWLVQKIELLNENNNRKDVDERK